MEYKGNGSLESFMCEHSAEYVVARCLGHILESAGIAAIPLYFWSSREGNRMSRHVHSSLRGRLIAVFPRRPKLHIEKPGSVYWKINEELHRFANAADHFGIVTIGALPIASSILDLLPPAGVIWLKLGGKVEECVVNLHVSSTKIDSTSGKPKTLGAEEIVSVLQSNSKILNWEEMLFGMSQLRLELTESHHAFMGGSSYKPVYFLMPE